MNHSYEFWEGYADAYAGRDMVLPSLEQNADDYINSWLDYVEGYVLFLEDVTAFANGSINFLPTRSEGDY